MVLSRPLENVGSAISSPLGSFPKLIHMTGEQSSNTPSCCRQDLCRPRVRVEWYPLYHVLFALADWIQLTLIPEGWDVPRCCCCPTPWNIAHQAPLSMGFPRQEYWSGLPFSSPGDLPDPGLNLGLLSWQVGSLPLSHQGNPIFHINKLKEKKIIRLPQVMQKQWGHVDTLKLIVGQYLHFRNHKCYKLELRFSQ